MALNARGDDKNPYLRAGSLDELLDWYDVDFVRCAYVTLLGRQPDSGGEDHYVGRLRYGRSRLAILRELRASREGRMHDPGIAGLDRTLRRHAWQRMLGLSWLSPRLSGLKDGGSSRDRQFQALMNTVMVNRIELHQLGQSLRSSPETGVELKASEARHFSDVAGSDVASKRRISVPELKRLLPTSPLQRSFVSNRG